MKAQHLGDLSAKAAPFAGEDAVFKRFSSPSFAALGLQKKRDKVSEELLGLIEQAPEGLFLLPSVMQFIDKVGREGVVSHYLFSTFELWLNQVSGLSFEENYRVRGKIAGRFVPRDEYQVLFPIGGGKIHPGSHFVTAHSSPDLDTTVASFWGWVDAFAARVGEGLHVWNVPGGTPAAVEISLLFHQKFGADLFRLLAKDRGHLSVSSLDLMTQGGVAKKHPSDSTLSLDADQSLDKGRHAVLLVDDQGLYLGEWRATDVENVRFVITLLNQCLRWYENNLHVQLVSFFAQKKLSLKELSHFVKTMFEMRIGQCEPAKEFSERDARLVEDYLVKVLGVEEGLQTTFKAFALAMKNLEVFDFQEFVDLSHALEKSPLFDAQGSLKESRPEIFAALAKIIQALDKAIYSIRLYVEKLGVALKVKTDVLGAAPHPISYRADLEEVRSKIDGYSYLAVTLPDSEDRLYPLGVIYATDLFKTTLGTVTLRDFCNRDETKIPPYLEVISVIDHHKSALATSSPPVAFITDSQSSNALVAEISFAINDSYSQGNMTLAEIEKEIAEVQKNLKGAASKRILQRLLQRHLAAEKKSRFFVAPDREATEYLHCLYAIMDDTDLLTKVSARDVVCVASLLNRLKSLQMKKEVEIVHFDDIARDSKFAKAAARRLLQNDDLYSLYSKIYASKEEGVDENIKLAASGKPSTVFADTKVQNGCCRVGQTKLFAKNTALFEKHAAEIRRLWLLDAQKIFKEKKEVDLHLHMISTVTGAKELYEGAEVKYPHKDEIWLWIPSQETAISHLKSFLSAFGATPQAANNEMEVEFLGDNAKELEEIFIESFIPVPRKISAKGLVMALLRFKAGTINSRKAMISPYLPAL